MRVSQFVNQYTLLRRQESAKHLENVQRASRRFIEANGDIAIYEVSEEHIARFLSEISRSCESSHTVKHYLTLIKAVINEAFQEGLVRRLPRFPRVRVERRLPDAWTVEELQRLFDYVGRLDGYVGVIPASLWWSSLLMTAYYTGLRLSALLSISWFQVDLTGHFLRALTKKTKKEQVFAIPQELANTLEKMQAPPREKVWEHPYNSKWPCKALRRIVDRAGIPAPKNLHGQLFQKMRRTCITWTAVNDLNMATRVAGHASPETTIRHYVDPRMLGAITPAVPRLKIKVS